MARYNRDKVDTQSEQFRKLFIGGLTLNTTENDLRNFYGKWGEIVDAVVMINKQTGRSRGFGFVTYSDPEMVNTAQSNRPHKINDRVVEAKRATPREESDNRASKQAINRLFIGGMKKELTEDMIRDYFSDFGNITEIEIPKNKETGEPRGFCFITFDDYDPVDKAVLIKKHTINNISFDVKKAISRDQINNDSRRGEASSNSYLSPKDRRGSRAPPAPPAHYYDAYPRYPYPGSVDPYYSERYESHPSYPQSYDDAYGNGWSDAGYNNATYGGSFGSYEEQSYGTVGPIRERGGYGSEMAPAPYRPGPYQTPRPRGPTAGPRR